MSRSETFRDLDPVVLLDGVAGCDAAFRDRMFDEGATGTIVHVYEDGAAYEVELFGPDGDTIGFVTAEPASLGARRTADAA